MFPPLRGRMPPETLSKAFVLLCLWFIVLWYKINKEIEKTNNNVLTRKNVFSKVSLTLNLA